METHRQWLTVVEIRDKEMVAASAHVSVRAEVPRIVFSITVPAIVDRTSAAKQPADSPGSTACRAPFPQSPLVRGIRVGVLFSNV